MLDLIKDYMRLSCISRTESQSAVYEFDCIIPDILPDMAKILAIDAAAGIETISKGSSSATVISELIIRFSICLMSVKYRKNFPKHQRLNRLLLFQSILLYWILILSGKIQ